MPAPRSCRTSCAARTGRAGRSSATPAATKDPLLALGLCDALRDACLLGEAAGAGLTGSAPLDEALAGYGRRRDEATLPDYHRNILAAQLRDKPPDELALRAALRGRQDDINHFYRVRQAMDSRESFFNDDNLARIVAAA